MPEEPEIVRSPEITREPTQNVHEYTVDQVRDVTRQGKVVLESGVQGTDTAFRQLFPTTYDLVLDHPEAKETAEDK
ncbi:hypothetical protein ACWEQG_05825 [Microbispora sp. NPDC004025]